MKPSFGRIFAVAITSAALSTGACALEDGPEIGSSGGDELGGLLFGQPILIGFDNSHLVNLIEIQVARGWLKSDAFSLAIRIDGVNHGDHKHGSQVVPLSATEILGEERAIALVRVDWNSDAAPTSSPEKYTACVQVINSGGPLGDEMCGPMGEF